jgi:hypothetical protein
MTEFPIHQVPCIPSVTEAMASSANTNKFRTNCDQIINGNASIKQQQDHYTSHDVLCGRGKVSLVHEGNKFFRETVEQYLDAYIYAKNQPDRSQVIQTVIDTILNTGGKFKKKKTNDPHDSYIPLSNQQCRDKVRP